MSADRGAYIDQSQSLNIHIAEPSFGKMSSMHFYAWKKGLKTGLYYLRTRPAADPIKFTVDKTKLKATTGNKTQTEKITTPVKNGTTTTTTATIVNGIKSPFKNGAPIVAAQIIETPIEQEQTNGDIDTEIDSNTNLIEQLKLQCSRQNKEACMMCSS